MMTRKAQESDATATMDDSVQRLPWVTNATGISLRLRATPRSARNAIKGIIDLPDGPALTIAITAPPVDGAANVAIIATLAKALHIPKSAITVVSGATARIKRVEIFGEAAILETQLRAQLRAVL